MQGLTRNLISSGTFDVRGYRYSYQGGTLKVPKGAMGVPKGEMSRGLYRLVTIYKSLKRKTGGEEEAGNFCFFA